MYSKVEIEDAIDALRRNASRSALASIIGAMARGKARLTTGELGEVLDATILAVIEKFRKAESTPEIAAKLWSIVEHKVADLINGKPRNAASLRTPIPTWKRAPCLIPLRSWRAVMPSRN